MQAFGLQLTQHITNDACLVYGPPVKKLCLKWCKSCLESIFLAFAGPERANAFQYIPILCFWMLLDPWDSHGMNETWIIYDYMVISGRVMFPKPCVLPFWTQKSTVACNIMTRMSSQNDSASPQERRSPNSQPKGTLDSTGFWDTQFLRRSQK